MAASSRLNLPAWQALNKHREQLGAQKVRDMFAADPRRFASLSREAVDLLFDFSRQRLQPETIALLIQLARECDLETRIAALLAGERVNNTEDRPALHTALRRSPDQSLFVNGRDVMRDVKAEREKLFNFVRDVHEGRITGHTGKKFEAVINIGIGGSDLGPVMAVEALARFRARGLEMHFVSNVDGCQLADAIASTRIRRQRLSSSARRPSRHSKPCRMRNWHVAGLSSASARLRCQNISLRCPSTSMRWTSSASALRCVLRCGTGSVGDIRCGLRSEPRLRWLLVQRTSRRSSTAAG